MIGEGGAVYMEKEELCVLCKKNKATMRVLAKAQEGPGEPSSVPIVEAICFQCFFKHL